MIPDVQQITDKILAELSNCYSLVGVNRLHDEIVFFINISKEVARFSRLELKQYQDQNELPSKILELIK